MISMLFIIFTPDRWQISRISKFEIVDKKITVLTKTAASLYRNLINRYDKEQSGLIIKNLATTKKTKTIGVEAVSLDIPIISQLPELPTGCEITAATMMLNYKGANVDKLTLAKEMNYSTYDPNLGFIGSPFKTNGYTINPKALLGIVTKYAGSAVDLTGSETSVLESYLQSNKPVVLWMEMDNFKVHAITLCGYDSYNFYYNDPWTGEKNAAMDRITFLNKWNAQNRKALSY